MKNLYLLLIALLTTVTFFAAPPNDICTNAENITITTTSTTTVNLNTNACTDSGETSTCENNTYTYIDQYYSFTMPVNGNLKITNGSGNDFYTLFDTCSGTEIDCFNFYKGTFYNLTVGSSYILRVSNRDIYTRTGTFKVQAFQTPPNDICANAENITITTTSTTTVNLNTNACTDSGETSTCENTTYTYIDQYYSFTMPVNGNLKITNGSSNDFYTLFDTCSGTEIDCFNFYLGTFYNLTVGSSYILRVSNRDINTRTGTFKVQAFQTPPNNICANAENITITTTSTTTVNLNTNACTDSGETSTCENNTYTYIDQYYSFTMPVNGNLKIIDGSGNDFYTLFDTCSGTEIECFNFYLGTFYNLTAGTSYILRVSNRDINTRTGTFKVQAFQTPPNDICANAENISITTTSTTTVNLDTNACTDSGETSTCENTTYTYIDQYYSFTMPVNGNLKITNGSGNDFYTLFDTCSGTEIDCFNFYLGTFYNLAAGTSYILRVSNRDINTRTGTFKVQAFQSPPNDICANAENISITTTSTTTVNLDTNACTDSGETSTCENTTYTYIDQYYSFTMPVNGNLKITNGTNNDVYTLFDACNGTEIDCFNFYFGTFYNLVSGTSYILRVSNRYYQTRTGTFEVQAFETATNDLCTDAINLSVGLYDEYLETKTLFGATPSSLPVPVNSCGTLGTGEDVWFTIQVPATGSVTVETSQALGSTLNDTVLQIFTGSCGSFTEITCDDNSGNGNFAKATVSGQNPGDTLYIRVFENGSNIADYYNIFAYDSTCSQKTVWNGSNWSNGIPDNTFIAEFDANYSADNGNIDACMCKINNGVTVDINSSQYLKIENNLINNGTLNINHQGSFVQVDNFAQIIGTGNFKTVIKTTGLQDTDRFTYLSSPVQNNTLNVLNSWAKMNYLWDFDGTIQDWRHLPNTNTLMTPGKGFAIEGANNLDYSTPYIATTNFTGKFNNGTITQTVYYNAGGIDNDNTLVGNPYPSAIKISSLLDNAINPSVNSVYVWTHNSPLISGTYQNDDYIVCSSASCTSAYAGNNSNNLTNYLASGQGFFIDTVDGTSNILTFNNSMRVTGNNTDFRRPANYEQIWINITSNLGYFNQIGISFTPIGTTGFDQKIDALRLGTYYGLGFYSIGENNERLAINDRGVFANETIIPLGLYLNDPQANTLTISIDHLQNMNGITVYLKDHLTNIIHNLKTSNYTFSVSETGIFNNRFELIFQRSALDVSEITENTESLIVNNYSENEIKISTKNGSNYTQIELFDILGKELINQKTNANNTILNTNIKQGTVLFIKAKLKNGKVLMKKFIKI